MKYLFPILMVAILATSLLRILSLPPAQLDDQAFFKFTAHATPALVAATQSAAASSTPEEITRNQLRMLTVHIYPGFSGLIAVFEHWFSAYDYVSVFLSMFVINALTLLYLFYVRRRYPSEQSSAVDLAFLLVVLDAFLLSFDWYRYFPFGNGGDRWLELVPRGAILTLYLSQLYLYFGKAPWKTRLLHFGVIVVITHFFNAPYSLLIAVALLVAYGLAHLPRKFPLEFLLPLFFVLLYVVLSFGLHIPLHFTKRAFLWLIETGILLYVTRRSDSFVRRMFIVLASFSLAAQFFGYDLYDQFQLSLNEVSYRVAGLTEYLFLFVLAEALRPAARRLVALALVPVIVYLLIIGSMHDPLSVFFTKTHVETLPNATDERDFYLYFAQHPA